MNNLRDFFSIPQALKPRTEGGNGHGSGGYDGSQSQKRREHEESPPQSTLAPTPEQEKEALDAALVEFRKRAATEGHGLQANVLPGLKVVLQAPDGRKIRELGASEFIRLQSSGTGDTRGRGKLLDQKL